MSGARPSRAGMSVHELRTWPDGFEGMWRGVQPYTIRRADRPFAVGDRVIFCEWDPRREVNSRYTGRIVVAEITHITEPMTWHVPEHVCVFGLRFLDRYDERAGRAQGAR